MGVGGGGKVLLKASMENRNCPIPSMETCDTSVDREDLGSHGAFSSPVIPIPIFDDAGPGPFGRESPWRHVFSSSGPGSNLGSGNLEESRSPCVGSVVACVRGRGERGGFETRRSPPPSLSPSLPSPAGRPPLSAEHLGNADSLCRWVAASSCVGQPLDAGPSATLDPPSSLRRTRRWRRRRRSWRRRRS